MRLFALILIMMLSVPALALQPGEALEDPADEARARALMAELRCLVCQNESIEASPSPFAGEVRAIVREQVVSGRSDGEIKDFLSARYGDEILLRPRVGPETILLWAGPFLLLLIGIVVVVLIVRRSGAATEPERLGEEELKKFEKVVGE